MNLVSSSKVLPIHVYTQTHTSAVPVGSLWDPSLHHVVQLNKVANAHAHFISFYFERATKKDKMVDVLFLFF